MRGSMRPAVAPAFGVILLALGAGAPRVAAEDHGGAHAASGNLEHAEGRAAELDEAHGAAAHDEHHGTNWPAVLVNFAIFAGGLYYVLNKPVRAFFRERRAAIATSFTAAQTARHESEARLAELEVRLSGLDGQIEEILAKARDQAAAERELVLEQARTDAARILSQAETQVSELEAQSVRRLKLAAADLAVEVAREIIEKQLEPADRSRFFDRTLKNLAKTTPGT